MATITTTNRILGDTSAPFHRPFLQTWQADGINDYLFSNTVNMSNFFWPDKSFTLSFWLNWQTPGSLFPNRSTAFMVVKSPLPWVFSGVNANSVLRRFFVYYTETGIGVAVETGGLFFIAFSSVKFVPGSRYHVVITHPGSVNYTGTRIYVNRRNIEPLIFGDQTPDNSASFPNEIHFLGRDIGLDFSGARHADLMLSSVVATPTEVTSLFNLGTNDKANYPAYYPARIMNSRQLHLPLGDPSDFAVISSQLKALDISGNNRHMDLIGQATPTLQPFY